jgi:NADH-quinone oxidoreductase subunit N
MGCSVVVLAGPGTPTFNAAGALLFYILVYTFMNLGAFTVAGLIANATGSEDIRDYADLKRRSPALALLMTVFLLSLFGFPGLGGFMAKILLAIAMTKIGFGGYVLIAVLLLNTLFSLWYYMRPVYFMFLQPDSEDRPAVAPHGIALAVLALCAAMLIWTGIFADLATTLTREQGSISSLPTQPAVVSTTATASLP